MNSHSEMGEVKLEEGSTQRCELSQETETKTKTQREPKRQENMNKTINK